MPPARFVLQTVPMTWPLYCRVIEGYCHLHYVVTEGMSIVRHASIVGICHCQYVRRKITCKSMGKIFIKGNFVTNPASRVAQTLVERWGKLRVQISGSGSDCGFRVLAWTIVVSVVMTCTTLTTTCGHPNITVLIITSRIDARHKVVFGWKLSTGNLKNSMNLRYLG